MYLDTDIILGLTKKEDWLKKHINFTKIKDPKTSVFTIIEARLVLEREYSREEALDVLSAVRRKGIQLLSFDEKVLTKSQELLRKYERLNHFDAIHVAFAIENNETLLSTDHIFSSIEIVDHKDPRDL